MRGMKRNRPKRTSSSQGGLETLPFLTLIGSVLFRRLLMAVPGPSMPDEIREEVECSGEGT